jgi:TolB-like protein
MSKFNNFWGKFKKRKILRVALTYFVVTWILVQIGSIVFPALNLPEWTITLLIVLLVFLFPVAMFLAWTHEKGSDGFTITDSAETKKNHSPSNQKKSLTLNLVLISLLIILLLWYFVRPAIYSDSVTTNNDFLENKSIAVLYFDNMSGDPDQEYFSDGITEEIIARLSKVEGIRVISRTSTHVYKGKPINLKTIAKELNVSAILEGSFRKSGNQIKITAQLINAKTDEHIWAETYSRELNDIFQVQSDIAHAIAKKFEMNISDQTALKINKFPTSNTKAYDYYLKARHFFYDQFSASGDSLDLVRSKDLFEKAIELDSSFAEAYAGLADLYDGYRNNYRESFTEKMDSTRFALSKIAYSLSPNSSFVNHVRGWMFIHRDDPKEDSSYYYFKKARSIDPNDHLNYTAMGSILRKYQLDDLALPYNLKAVKINPLDAGNYTQLGYSYWMLGDLDNAGKSYQTAYDIGLKYGFSGIPATAFWMMSHGKINEAKQLIENHDINWWFLDAYLLALEKDHIGAHKYTDVKRSAWSWWGKAEIYALLDEKENALDALMNFANEYEGSLYLWIQNTNNWQKYQDDPDFQIVLEAHKNIYEENKEKYGFEYDDFVSTE